MSTMHRAKTGPKTGLAALLLAMTLAGGVGPAVAAEGEHAAVPRQKWTFGGFLGKFDDAQLQRGFRVYMDVCARCHGLSRVYFRNLAEPGGPGFPEAAVKSLAATFQYDDAPNDQGKIVKRPGTLTDRLPSPYKNEQEARATYNGALPPDFSVIAKARSAQAEMAWYREPLKWATDIVTGYQEGGPDYIYALLMSYPADGKPPAGLKNEDGTPFKLADGMNFNTSFPGYQIAMAKPAIDDKLIKYTDGAPQTQDQYARDVTAFLMWAAEPKLDQRKRIGMQVLLYLGITSLLLWLAKRRLWARVEH